MGGSLSTTTRTDAFKVEITPQFYDENNRIVTDVVYKKNASYKINEADDLEYLFFSRHAQIVKHNVVDGKLMYHVRLPFLVPLRRLRSNVKEGWWRHTNAGDPVSASSIVKNKQLYFRANHRNVIVNH